MVLIGKISKGSKMDQIYIPKNRVGLYTGSYVKITPIDNVEIPRQLYFHNVKNIEPIKVQIVKNLFEIIDNYNNDNIIITGSFLEKGFNFNDIDILVISEKNTTISKEIESKLKINPHIIFLTNKELQRGLETDPLYQLMLDKCIAKNRFIYKFQNKPNYKILDLHLLKSAILPTNFDILDGRNKYYLIRNIIAIDLYIKNKKLTKENIDNTIKSSFNLNSIDEIRNNMLDKSSFIKKYNNLYKKISEKIMKGVKDGSKQE